MVVLGKITGAFGIQGWVRVHPFGDDPQSWSKMASWYLSRDAESKDWDSRVLLEAKWHGDGLVAHLKGCDDRTAAEALRGFFVGVPRADLPEGEEGEYYWADLVGLAAVNLAGEKLGRVEEVMQGVAHDVLRLKDEAGTERLLPFVDAVVKEVDVAAGRLVVDWGADWGLP
jgi:16S rRNA processing protein RimM